MKYQVVIAGIGGQGAVFLVKVLALASKLKDQKCLATENHGMSQRGGSVSCFVKIGEFYSPAMDENQANLLIALEENEGLRNIQYLNKEKGTLIVNADETFPKIEHKAIKIDAFKRAKEGAFPIQSLNVYMLGITLACDQNFPFSVDEIEDAIRSMNAKMADKNIEVLHLAINDAKDLEK